MATEKVPIGFARCSGVKGHISHQDMMNSICSNMPKKSVVSTFPQADQIIGAHLKSLLNSPPDGAAHLRTF